MRVILIFRGNFVSTALILEHWKCRRILLVVLSVFINFQEFWNSDLEQKLTIQQRYMTAPSLSSLVTYSMKLVNCGNDEHWRRNEKNKDITCHWIGKRWHDGKTPHIYLWMIWFPLSCPEEVSGSQVWVSSKVLLFRDEDQSRFEGEVVSTIQNSISFMRLSQSFITLPLQKILTWFEMRFPLI